MTTSALILMVTVQVIVTCITAYFFYQVLRGGKGKSAKPEDSNKA
jgi:hypothetical protein